MARQGNRILKQVDPSGSGSPSPSTGEGRGSVPFGMPDSQPPPLPGKPQLVEVFSETRDVGAVGFAPGPAARHAAGYPDHHRPPEEPQEQAADADQ